MLSQSGLDLPIVLAVYERMKAEGISLFLYDKERVYHVLPFKTGDEDYWSKKLRAYGEQVSELAEADKVMAKVQSGQIKVVKMAVCEEESVIPGMLLVHV